MKKRKIVISILIVFFIAAAGVGYYFVHLQKVSAAVSSQEIVLEDGQELLYAKITSISGNEMEYAVLEAQNIDMEEMGNGRGNGELKRDTDNSKSDGIMPSDSETSFGDGMPSNGGISPDSGASSFGGEMLSGDEASFGNGMPSNGEMPSGGGGNFMNGMPSGGQNGEMINGQMPSGGQNGEMPNGQMSSNNQNGSQTPLNDMQNKIITTYTETGKTGHLQIPVGTDVETKLGTVTTFSRLSNGDTIKMLMQNGDNDNKDLLKIWIVE